MNYFGLFFNHSWVKVVLFVIGIMSLIVVGGFVVDSLQALADKGLEKIKGKAA